MQRRFIARKNNNIFMYKYKIIIYLLLILTGFIITIKLLNINNKSSNNYDYILSIGTNNIIGTLKYLNNYKYNLQKPENLLKMSFSNINIKNNIINNQETITVNKEEKNPIIYIYNTHQTEEYNAGALSYYNIIPTVYMASNMLKKSLSNYQINSIVEDENMKEVLNNNGLNYNDSYDVSMKWLKNAVKENDSLKYFIDVHRDSVSSSVTINDKEYAKMMFVVGMNHENYEKNESLSIKLNEYLKENYEGLMRNMFYGKKSKYNQHFNENTILIEVGGPENTISQVNNSINALADALYHVIGEY